MPAPSIVKSIISRKSRTSLKNTLAAATLLVAAGAVLVACQSDDTDRIRGEVQFLTQQERGEAVQSAAERLVRHGRKALPPIEAALHTAEPRGRKNLILALRRLGDEEAVPLLRHRALYDEDAEVRREAEWTLRQWSTGTGTRAERAQRAVRELDERQGREEAG